MQYLFLLKKTLVAIIIGLQFFNSSYSSFYKFPANNQIGVQIMHFPGEKIPKVMDIFSLSGGFSTGKTTVLTELRKDNNLLKNLKKHLLNKYKNKPAITFAFLSEAAIIIVKKWQKNGKITQMVRDKRQGNVALLRNFQQEILELQVQQLESLPSYGIVIVMTDRFLLDGAGYCKLANIPKKEIDEMYKMHEKYKLSAVFMFNHFIKDVDNKAGRFEAENIQALESNKLSQALQCIYKSTGVHMINVGVMSLESRLILIKNEILNFFCNK